MPAVSATVQDVEDLLGVTAGSLDDERVERLLVKAEGTIADELPGFTFGPVAGEEVTLDPDGDDLLRLPYYPVTDVTAVAIGGVALAAGSWSFDALGNVRRRAVGVAAPSAGDRLERWPDRGTDIVVTYDYGVASSSPPAVIAAVVAELAAGRIVNPSQASQETLGDRSISYGAGANTDGLSSDQRHRLRHWRRNRFASARVRS